MAPTRTMAATPTPLSDEEGDAPALISAGDGRTEPRETGDPRPGETDEDDAGEQRDGEQVEDALDGQ